MGVDVGSVSDLERGRQSFAQAGWADAYDALTAADLLTRLGASDLELLARAAYMLGRDDDYVSVLERAYRAHLEAGAPTPAVRCAFWIGHSWLFRGEAGPGLGWFARAQRLFDRELGDVPERGYVLIAEMLEHLSKGDTSSAHETAVEIAGIGERFGDPDLVAIGLMEQGHALVRLDRGKEGVRLIDETMVAVTSGELSPIVAGIVYCNTIAFCRGVYQLRRVREWTVALTRWCERQPQMVAHKGLCLVHRAEIMTLGGAWDDALEELRRLDEQFRQGVLNQWPAVRLPTVRARCTVSAASSPSRKGIIARRVGLAGSPNLALPSCAWRRAILIRRLQRSAGPWLSRRTGCRAWHCCPPTSRSCLRSGTSAPPAAHAESLTRSRRSKTARPSTRCPVMREGQCPWPRVMPRAHWLHCGAPGRGGSISKRRTTRHVLAP
jgi:hypothetical protein